MAEKDPDTAVQDDGPIATDPSRCPDFRPDARQGVSPVTQRSSSRARRVRTGGLHRGPQERGHRLAGAAPGHRTLNWLGKI